MKKWPWILLPLLMMMIASSAESLSERSPSCRVWVNGNELDTVYQTAVCNQRFWEENPSLSDTPVAIAVQDGPYRVEVEFLNAVIQTAVVRPLSLGIEAEILDGRICFFLEEPANLSVEYNGQIEGVLHLFLDSPDTDKPDLETPKVRYFGPGVYRDQITDGRAEDLAGGDLGNVHL